MKEGKCKLIGAICPRNGDPAKGDYCPFWNETGQLFTMRNNITGEEKVEQCAAKTIAFGQIEVIKASNRPAEAVESTRNEMAKGFAQVADLFTRLFHIQQSTQRQLNQEEQHASLTKEEDGG